MNVFRIPLIGLSVVTMGVSIPAQHARAAPAPDDAAADVSEVVVTGTRRSSTRAVESAVPIDVFSGEEITAASNGDMNDMLRSIVPSYNVQRFPINDGSTFVRPSTLRGLPPDETLVLVNSKRRHRSALVQLGGGSLAEGAQGADLAQIPAIALKQVEVLRDGASAQYGSDAIAGVMNFILRDDAEGWSLGTETGRYFAGDGESLKVSGNIGLPLTSAGFFNLSAEYVDSDLTSRGIQRPDAQALIDSGEPYASHVPRPAQIWGSPEVEAVHTFWNSGLELSPTSKLYAFGNYATSDTGGSFFYRNPVTSGILNTVMPVDLDDPDGATFTFAEMFPGGFTPWFSANIKDFSQVLGVRGKVGDALSWDVSGSYGHSKINYRMTNSINPSLGLDTPTSFRPGTLAQTERNVNLDLAYDLPVAAFASPLTIAGGLEYREEVYEIGIGDEASWALGPYSAYGVPVGSNGFQGYDPTQAGEFRRDNVAAYVDFEADVTERLLIGIAGRYEDFSDFGSQSTGKIAARLKITPSLSVRATASTGFRAPTPGQTQTRNVTTGFDPGNPIPISRGTIPATDPIARFFGARTLKPEESDNLSIGIVANPLDNLSVTLDAYRIKVKDRIALSGNIDISPEQARELEAAGFAGATSLGTIRFLTNDFDTTTEGLDLVTKYAFELPRLGRTSLALVYNFNETSVDSYSPDVITRERVVDLERQLPKHRGSLTLTQRRGPLSLMVRGSYYGSFADAGAEDDGSTDEFFGSEWLVDVEASYLVKDRYELAIGGVNVFDNYPDHSKGGVFFGLTYPDVSPFGFDGGYWYGRLTVRFD